MEKQIISWMFLVCDNVVYNIFISARWYIGRVSLCKR